MGIWQEIFQEIKEWHDQYNKKIVQEYLRQQRVAEHNVRFLFSPGDKVLLRHVVPGKLNLKVKGLYVFVHYTSPLQVTTCITGLDGTEETCLVSAANLLPMRPKLPASVTAAESDEHDWAEDASDNDSSREEAAIEIGDQQGRGLMQKRARSAT